MKTYISLLCCLLLVACESCYNKVDTVVASYWKKHQTEKENVIDLSKEFDFEWDTLCYYSVGCNLEEINHDLGVELTEYTDLAERMIFLYHGNVVYIAGWWYDPENPHGVTINSSNKKFRTSRNKAKFVLTKEGDVFILSPYPR